MLMGSSSCVSGLHDDDARGQEQFVLEGLQPGRVGTGKRPDGQRRCDAASGAHQLRAARAAAGGRTASAWRAAASGARRLRARDEWRRRACGKRQCRPSGVAASDARKAAASGGARNLPNLTTNPMAVNAGNKIRNAKLVLLGDVGAGKSSLVLRFVKGQFVEFQESTIGAAFFSQTLAVNDETVKFEIWDTAGQERYHSLAPMYYRGAAAAIVVYDITNPASFTRAKKWVQELQSQGNSSTVVALAGNKADLLETRQVQIEEAKTYAQENGLFFMETSAKTAINVNDIFYEIAKRLLQGQPAQNPQAGMVLTQRPNERLGQ
ncbi:hypothetical protein GUJ93_ZPchr0003g18181 [Zizania palustris]|uniref:Uncharacterized protein n=1 Tax=Zizania palustris TaxID=103762 RepID=A0A8J5SB69_ZIZPA|nr:hypothetical protein GUJ93_ZPchr0003g18181 [Zizania palustris]